MHTHLTYLLLQWLLLTGPGYPPHGTLTERWVIDRSSSLCIQGRSNINSFRCDIIEYLRPDTIVLSRGGLNQAEFPLKGGMAIDIDRFDCHQRYITNDFRKTLKSKDGDVLRISLLSIGNFMPGQYEQQVKGRVAISLAGVTRTMEVDYTVQAGTNGLLNLVGQRQVLFSDFGLTPPRKAGGLIKVQETLDVSFRLMLHAVKTGPDTVLR